MVRPVEGAQITVLVDVHGVPVTHVATAGRVRETTIIVPRRPQDARLALEPQGLAVVLFTHAGRLYSWPMRVEEVLPSSYYLVSVRDPSEGERRRFVRAPVAAQLRVGRQGEALLDWADVEVELSASGVRLPCAIDAVPGELLDLVLRVDGQPAEIATRARVIRRFDGEAGRELACEFVELTSADEDRLLQAVFRVREQVLFERIGRRDFS